MDAILGLGATSSNYSCNSVAEFTAELQNQLATKSPTPTRAEHISITFELLPTMVFNVNVAEGENEALENANNIDPLLGGARSSSAAPSHIAPLNNAANVRTISANKTLINQPRDDPVNQKAVAKYLVGLAGNLDNSLWTVRQIAREAQGWTFKYICRESLQNWTRQTAKNPAKLVIGEWSNKDGQDPINMSRPAFDCRGQITIEFLRSNRTINVKYEHTCLHSSVSHLIDILAPPPPPLVSRAPAANKEKAPKTPKTPRSQGKRRRQENGDAPEDGTQPQPKKRRKKKSTAGASNGDASGGTPANAGGSAQTNGVGAPPASLHLSAEEISRRRIAARTLLSNHGVDPDTLSEDQMEIFQNQSPELQIESLQMLVKYGAERLRIVHPTSANSESSAAQGSEGGTQAAASPATEQKKPRSRKKSDTAAASSPAVASTVETPAKGSARKNRPTRGACEACKNDKEKCDKVRPSCSRCINNGSTCYYAPPVPRKNKKSTFGVDVDDSEQAEQVEQEDQDAPTAAADLPALPAPIALTAPEQADEEEGDLPSPGFHSDNNALSLPTALDQHSLPVDEPLSSVVDKSHNFSESGPPDFYSHTGLTFPETPSAVLGDETHYPSLNSASADRYNQVADANISTNGYMYPNVPSLSQSSANVTGNTNTDLSYSERPAAALNNVQQTRQSSPRQSRSKPRRSLPSGQPSVNHASSAEVGQGLSANASDSWQYRNPSTAAVPTGTPTTTSQSPTTRMSARQSSRGQASSSSATPVSSYSQQASYQQSSYTATNQPQAASVSQFDAQRTTRSPQVQDASYPAAAQAARAKSRQGHRAQTRTPVQDNSAMRQPQASAQATVTSTSYASNTMTSTAGNSTSSAAGYDGLQHYPASRTETSNSRITYEPYTSQSNSDRYSYNYGNQSTPVTQSVSTSTSYPATTASNASQWNTNSTSQNRAGHSYGKNQNATATPSRSSATTRQSQAQQGFSVRPQSNVTQTRSSSTYSQPGQQSGYNGYQAPSSSNQQNNWYGFTAANNSASGYKDCTTRNDGTGGYGNEGSHAQSTSVYNQSGHHQGHRSMNLTDHTFNNVDDGYFNLLRNNHGAN